MEKIIFVFLVLLALTAACDRSSKPLPQVEQTAQFEASRVILNCKNQPCLLQDDAITRAEAGGVDEGEISGM